MRSVRKSFLYSDKSGRSDEIKAYFSEKRERERERERERVVENADTVNERKLSESFSLAPFNRERLFGHTRHARLVFLQSPT